MSGKCLHEPYMLEIGGKLTHRAKRTEYVLEGRNLLNTGTYNQRIWSDITNYQYNYILRPLSVMFKIRFSIGAR